MTARPLLLALALSSCLREAATAQPSPRSDSTIRLRARSFVPASGIDSATLARARISSRTGMHVIVQFRDTATAEERAMLSRTLGIRWLETLSDRVFLAGMRADATLLARLASRARWIGRLRPSDKLAPGARWHVVPAPPDSAPRNAMVVQFFADVPLAEQQLALVRNGAQRFGRIDALNGWMITLSPDSVTPLASEDAVLWIEPAPRNPRFDNDKVRAASGVNADPVLTPSAYALSGNGIIVGYWDGTIPSWKHEDLKDRIIVVDPINLASRNLAHADGGATPEEYDNGEVIYIDVDDSRSVTVSDFRMTGFAVPTAVAATSLEIGTTLVLFKPNEMYVDRGGSTLYEDGDAIYRDVDGDGKVLAGTDVKLTTPGAVDGSTLSAFPDDLHAHSTMVLGTIIGNGARSALETGTALQWKGLAPSAKARTYTVCETPYLCFNAELTADYITWLDELHGELRDAMNASSTIAAHPWGPATEFCHLDPLASICYRNISQIYDTYASGRQFDGLSMGFARLVLPIGSAGNVGYPERHNEVGSANDTFEEGESIYVDANGDFRVSTDDVRLVGPVLSDGTPLIDFQLDERHTISVDDSGSFVEGQSIYRDANNSATVDAGDVRLIRIGAFAAGTTVAAGDADVAGATALRRFAFWSTIQGANAGKNTLQIGAIASDATYLPAFSSRGPTLDGRIKPDIVAAGTVVDGVGVKSPSPRNTYGEASGTSISTGVAAGSAALLSEWYKNACVATGASPATLKALLIHAAEDVDLPALGAFAGPDFASGFGRLRVKEAVDLVANHFVGAMSAPGTMPALQFTIARTQSLKVTLVWSDVPWSLAKSPGDHGILQNDLDLLIVGPDGKQYGPWIADAANPRAGATRHAYASTAIVEESARDHRNTVEQVVVDDAQAGTWKIFVSSSLLTYAPQSYTVVSEALPPSVSPCARTPAADLWVRDNDTDVGTVPSGGSMWLGPDLWNRNAADGLTAHQNPEHGEANYLYVNIRNRTAVPVKAAMVELWIADASLGLSWPANYTYVGRIFVPNIAANEVRQVGPLQWFPPAPGLSGHFCMYMRVLTPQDPITIAEGSSIWTNAQTTNNIAYRNLHLVDLHSASSITFLVRNTERTTAAVEVGFRIPPELLSVGQVSIVLPQALDAQLSRSSRMALRGGFRAPSAQVPSPAGMRLLRRYPLSSQEIVLPAFQMRSGQTERITITFSSSQTTAATYNVDVFERIDARPIGGIRYVVRTGRRTASGPQ